MQHPGAPRRAAQRGFTLIELMIVVAVIGILSSVAMNTYQGYVRTTQAAKVTAHYDHAVKFVRATFLQTRAKLSMFAVDDFPADVSAWIALIDPDGASAPGGGPAFVPGSGDSTSGAVGISVAGNWAGRDVIITIEQPAFLDLALETSTHEL